RLDRQRRPLLSRWIEHTTLGLARKLVALGIDSSVEMFGCQPDQRSGSNDESKQYPQQREPASSVLERMCSHLQLQACEQAKVNYCRVAGCLVGANAALGRSPVRAVCGRDG